MGSMLEHDDPCERAKSTTPNLENYFSNYLKSCILNKHMPVLKCVMFQINQKDLSPHSQANHKLP